MKKLVLYTAMASMMCFIYACSEEPIDNYFDSNFCLNVNEAKLDNTIANIDQFLCSLNTNLADSVKLQYLADYLNNYDCINDAKVSCNACIFPSMGQTPYLRMSEITFNFLENGIKKHYVLDIWNDNVLRVAAFHKQFEPQMVIVEVKGYFTIDSVFNWINQLGFEVDYIQCERYTSNLSSDRLQYVLDRLNEKPYTHQGVWKVTGYLHYQTQQITIFPRLFEMHNKEYQADWLQTIIDYQLVEHIGTGYYEGNIILFKVPEGTEPEWVNYFTSLNFVNWAEVNAYIHITF